MYLIKLQKVCRTEASYQIIHLSNTVITISTPKDSKLSILFNISPDHLNQAEGGYYETK